MPQLLKWLSDKHYAVQFTVLKCFGGIVSDRMMANHDPRREYHSLHFQKIMPNSTTDNPEQAQSGLESATAQELFRRAEEWARANWSSKLPPISRIQMNPCLLHNCLSLKRFKEGAGVTNGDAILGLNTLWAWHGATMDAISAICCEGWLPSRRCSNASGYGEFFGPTADISNGYTKGSNRMIIALILKNSNLTESPGQHHIVMNPNCDTGPCYCLPVAVVSYGCGEGMSGWRHP
jgi:hypothetical protein